MSDDEICVLITTHVALVVRQEILKVFGSFKTTLIEMFDNHYVVVTEVVVTSSIATLGLQGGGSIQ